MKFFFICLCFFLYVSADGQNSPNPVELERKLPSSAKDEEYFRGGMDEKKRIDNVLLKKVSPTEIEKEKFKEFLALPKTGIVRLLKKKECPEKFSKRLEDLLEFAKKCPTSYITGNGANFSFRRKEYVDENQSDITYKNGLIFANGLLNQSIMVDLKNIPIEKVSLETQGLTFLKNYTPAKDVDEVDKQNLNILNGIENGGFLYGKGFRAAEDSTFALRVTAYKADLKTHTNVQDLRITFDPFHGDIREDILVVFRIFDINDDGAILIWRELQRKKSPELELKK